MKITVVNINSTDVEYIDITRNGKYGNPYSHKEYSRAAFKTASRKESLTKFREYLINNTHLIDELFAEIESSGISVLGCHCKPKSCHGDTYKELIESRFRNSISFV